MYIQTKKGEDEVLKLLTVAASKYAEQKKKYETIIDENKLAPAQLIPLPSQSDYKIGKWYLGRCTSDAFKTGYFNSTITSSEKLTERLEEIKILINTYIKDCEKVIEDNKPIIEHNEYIRTKVRLYMKELGVPDTYSHKYYKTSRSTRPTVETKKAGYLEDLDRLMGTTNYSLPSFDSLFRPIKNGYDKLMKEVVENERLDEIKKKEQEDLHKVALLRAKYTPDNASSNAYELRDIILDKDKYLRLAYWLERNRGDWTNGYDFAEIGLNSFEVDSNNPIDSEIYNDISELLENYDHVDGRCFRDCKYNYSVLYGMADEELIKDLTKITEWYDFT